MPISRSDETGAWLGRHRAPLVGYVLPLVNGDLQAAEDVVQETMLRGGGHGPVPLVLAGTNPATHVSATATLTATSWGTSIQLEIRGVPENTQCRLVLRSQGGRTEVTGAWDAWKEGPLNIPASASWLPSDIASIQVATPAETLLTIRVNHVTGKAGQ